jgi:serine/threonine protein kinase
VGFLSSLFGGGKGKGVPGVGRGVKRTNIAKRFELSGRTGQGSMSKVYRAYDRNLGRNVCLKLLDKDKTKRFEERFKGLKKPSEGEICMQLRHENIVRTFEVGVSTDGEPFLVMEWVEGHGLNYLIETKNAQLNGNRVNYMSQLCNAVQFLHDNKFLHRDLCPRNVMVDTEGVLKLIDFGLTIPYTPAFCAPGNRTGTPDYLPPELVMRRETDHRVDLYALGVTGYEVFTGSLPWERTPSSEENFRRRLNTPPRLPKELNPNLGDDVAKFLLKAISRDKADRFMTANRMKEAMEKFEKQDY